MKLILYLFISILFISCSSKDKDDIELNQNIYENNLLNDYELYEKANDYILREQYNLAIAEIDKLEVIFPSSPYSNKGMLLKCYIYFLLEEYEKTRALAETYIKYYPGSEDIVYANYLEAMTYYVQTKKPDYGQENNLLALAKFNFILNAYPNSKYEIDIITKINFLESNLSIQNLNIAKFYIKNKNLKGALIYLKENYERFSSSPTIEETLYLLTLIYHSLNENEISKYYASILAFNFPKSEWYNKSYNLLNDIEIKSNKDVWFEKYNPIKLFLNDIKEDNYDIQIIN